MKRDVGARGPRGYSLVIVMMTLGLITVSMLSLWAYMEASALSTGEIIKKRKSFYVCDGMTRVVGKLIGNYMRTLTAPPTVAGAEAYLQTTLPPLVPSNYALELIDVKDIEQLGDLNVPNGPFEGIIGRETSVRFRLRLRETNIASDFACQIDKDLALSQLALFQFGLFSALDATQLSHRSSTGGDILAITGRVHANGTVCSGDGGFGARTYIERLTSGGQLLDGSAACGNGFAVAPSGELRIGDFLTSTSAPTTDRLTTDSTSAGWPAFASGTLSGRVRDEKLGGAALELVSSTKRQAAERADGTAAAQAGELRFLVDPPLRGESDAELRNKLAYVADIRIIDGVWYKRDTANPTSWPGIPIWSDHPGDTSEYLDVATATEPTRTMAAAGRAIGQAQLLTALAWPSVPRRYSYYARAMGTGAFLAAGAWPALSNVPVISYGGLAHDGVLADTRVRRWAPAVIAKERAFPLAGNSYCNPAGGPFSGPTTKMRLSGAAACPVAGGSPTRAVDIAVAAGTSFSDGHLNAGAGTTRVLTTNFDVEAFQRALADGTSGELGSHFPPATRPFNGIVWISSLWPGDAAAPNGGWGGFAAGTVPSVSYGPAADATVRPIPFPLCSDSMGGSPIMGGPSPVNTPSCGAMLALAGPTRPWPNAVRIINARAVNTDIAADPRLAGATGMLPKGLTIASNLPVYVIGRVNESSTPLTPSSPAADAAKPWVPFLVAGDTVTLWSNDNDDGDFYQASTPVLISAATVYNMAILTGAPKPAGGVNVDLRGALRTMETWNLSSVQVNGAVALGYNPVYGGIWDNPGTPGPQYDLTFDTRLSSLDTQPPGGIHFNVQSTRQWERY